MKVRRDILQGLIPAAAAVVVVVAVVAVAAAIVVAADVAAAVVAVADLNCIRSLSLSSLCRLLLTSLIRIRLFKIRGQYYKIKTSLLHRCTELSRCL